MILGNTRARVTGIFITIGGGTGGAALAPATGGLSVVPGVTAVTYGSAVTATSAAQAVENVATSNDALGNVTTFVYDQLNRVTVELHNKCG